MKYRKRPVVIDAWQWDGENPFLSQPEWCAPGNGMAFDHKEGQVQIATKEGVMRASPGDWIIRGVQGEFYPCKPDIFAATYEAASEQDGK